MKKIIGLVLIGMIFLVGCDIVDTFFAGSERVKFVDYKKGISGFAFHALLVLLWSCRLSRLGSGYYVF